MIARFRLLAVLRADVGDAAVARGGVLLAARRRRVAGLDARAVGLGTEVRAVVEIDGAARVRATRVALLETEPGEVLELLAVARRQRRRGDAVGATTDPAHRPCVADLAGLADVVHAVVRSGRALRRRARGYEAAEESCAREQKKEGTLHADTVPRRAGTFKRTLEL